MFYFCGIHQISFRIRYGVDKILSTNKVSRRISIIQECNIYITIDAFKLLSLSSRCWNATYFSYLKMHRIPYEDNTIVWQFFNLKSFLKFIQQYTWMFEIDMRLFEYWLFWCSIFQVGSLRKEENRKRISFLKAIYAHKLVDLFCCCGFECKREDEEKEEKLNIQFIFRLSVPPHIWKQDRKNTTCVLDSLLIFNFKSVLLLKM